MTQALAWAACGTGFTFLMTALGAAAVFCFPGEPHPRFRQGMLGFAAGVMTAASVWSLLLPAIDRFMDEMQLIRDAVAAHDDDMLTAAFEKSTARREALDD